MNTQDTLNALSAAEAFAGALSFATHQGGLTSSTLSSGETVSLPSSGAGTLSVSDGSNQVDLGLPVGTSSNAGVEIAPSSTLYTSSSHFSVAATITTRGVREAVTLEDASAPTSYSFPVTLSPGEFLTSNPDGSVSVMQSFSGGSISVGEFLAPWAKDATGALVPTSYSVQGSTLVQHVETTPSTVFPVVADPWITWGVGPYINLWGNFIKAAFPTYQDWVNGGVFWYLACGAVSIMMNDYGVPGNWALVAGLICGFLGVAANLTQAASIAQINRELVNIDQSACFQYSVTAGVILERPLFYNPTGFPNSWTKVPNSNCANEQG